MLPGFRTNFLIITAENQIFLFKSTHRFLNSRTVLLAHYTIGISDSQTIGISDSQTGSSKKGR